MGHHGWQGDPPPTEELARERIVQAATRCLERSGAAKTSLSDVATEVGVTRQTVYRYFPNLTALLAAVAESGATDFIERMQQHLSTASSPVEAVVESIVFAIDEIPGDPRIGLLLEADELDAFGRAVTSETGLHLGARILRQVPVDWDEIGVHDEDFEGLAELTMRLMVSFLQHPPSTPRSTAEVRAFVDRWLAPALRPR